VENLVALAAALLERDDRAAAEGAANAALAVDPKQRDAWIVLGTALAKQNRHERALVCFEQVLALEPNDLASHVAMGELYLDLGAYNQAASSLEKAMSLDPEGKNPAGRRARAIVSKTLSRLKK
jgi:Tfp pilus assembly protein PilF